MLTKREAVALLVEEGSHAAYDHALAREVTQPFGFNVDLHTEYANTTPKGLLVNGVAPGTPLERIGGWELARRVAQAVGADTTVGGSKLGRGWAFRAYIEAINTVLDAEGGAK